MGNHDGSRMPTRMGREKTDLYNALVIMLPGTSVTYYVRTIHPPKLSDKKISRLRVKKSE